MIKINPMCKDTPILVGDIKDEASIGRIMKQAQVGTTCMTKARLSRIGPGCV